MINKKVWNLTHEDLDGAACSILLKNVFSSVVVEAVQYYELGKRLEEISNTVGFFNQYDAIYLTDLNLEAQHITKITTMLQVSNYQGELVILDHHEDSCFLHNPENNFYVVPGICAATITKEFLGTLTNDKMSYLDEFVTLTNDYDLWEMKYPQSKQLQLLYTAMVTDSPDGIKQGFNKFLQTYHKGISFNHLDNNDLQIIRKYENTINNMWDSLEVDVIPNTKIAMIGVAKKHSNEMCHRILESNVGIDVVINFNPRGAAASVRASERVNGMNLPSVIDAVFPYGGGGHKLAAGFAFPKVNYKMPFNEKWPIVQDWINKFTSALTHVYPELKA